MVVTLMHICSRCKLSEKFIKIRSRCGKICFRLKILIFFSEIMKLLRYLKKYMKLEKEVIFRLFQKIISMSYF